MRKAIATTILFFFSVGAMILLFSACGLFQDSHRNTFVLTGKDAEKFIGSIRTRHGDTESLYELGCYLQERKKHKAAIREFRSAVEIEPGHVKANNAMGISYDALGDNGRAVESYKAALKVYPKLDYVLNNLGYSYLLQGRTDLAVENLKKALEQDGGNARYRNNLGLAYAKSGRYDAALAEFKESGDEARAHYNIARLYYREGLYEKAKAHFGEASFFKASDPESKRGLKAAGSLAEINGINGKDPDIPGETSVIAAVPWLLGHNNGGFYTIPAGAHSTLESVEIAEPGSDEVPIYRATIARIDHGQETRQALRRMLEREIFGRLNEAHALELLSLQAADPEHTPARRIRIEVSNGNGVRLMARNLGNFLRGRDVILMYLSNARHFNHEETKMYYAAGNFLEAYRLAQKLPGRQSLEEVPEIREGNAEIKILIGKDLIPHLNLFKKS